jgi:GntR family transcriptional regulator
MVKKRIAFRPLDRHSGVPFYLQIQGIFLEHVRSGALPAGSSLPSEHEIARTFRVSRMTARHALKALSDLGVTYTLWGKGTFISSAKLEKDVRQVASFTDEMRSLGFRPSSQLLSCEITRPDEEAAEVLHVSRRDELVSIRRIRFANTSPMALEWSRIPRRFCPDLVEKFVPGASLYETLYEHYGLRMHVADEIVEAGLATEEVADLLHASKKAPVFLFTRTSYLASGEPIEFVKSVYRGDRYKIVNRLTRVRFTGINASPVPIAR